MKKNTGKVLSLVLAMAMVVTSFSATFVSASTLEVAGTKARVSAIDGNNKFKVVSDKYDDLVLIDDIDNAFNVLTQDRESVDDVEYVSFSKKSGDSLVKVTKDPTDKDKKNLYLRKGASGKETIVVTMKGTYTDDDTDKEVSVRGTIEVEITAYEEGEVILAPYGGDTITGKHPDALKTAAVNDSAMEIALYVAEHSDDNGTPLWTAYAPIEDDSMDDNLDNLFKTSSSKVFAVDPDDVADEDNHVDAISAVDGKKIVLTMIKTDAEGKDDSSTADVDERNYYAKVATTKIEMYAPKVTVNEADGVTVGVEKGDKIKETVGVGKKWRVGEGDISGSVIDKIGARTVIGSNPDPDDKYSDVQNDVKIVTGYEIIANGALSVNGGNIGNITGDGNVTVENATVGDIDTGDTYDISISNATVGTVKTGKDLDMDEGAKAEAINDVVGNVQIEGATVTGNVVAGGDVTITGTEDNKASVGGDVKFKGALDVTADDGAVEIKGALMANGDDVSGMNLSGNMLSVGSINADYRDVTVEFSEYKGAVAFTNVAAATVNLIDESNVTVNNESKLILASLDIEDGSTFTVTGEAKITDISGEGMLAVNSDKLYVNGGMDSVQFKLLDSPANGKVAFRAETDTLV